MTDKLVLNDISFQVEAGEIVGIVGTNGAGKSTLCQALVGLVPNFYKGRYGGHVFIDGMEVTKAESSDLVSKIGIVFQSPFTQVTGSKLTVFEEIAFGPENIGLPREEILKRVEYAMELLDIANYRNRNPFQLSGGQMQRMAIASIIAMRPEVIVFDEPTSQLDPQGSEEVFRAIQTLSKEGMTILIVESIRSKNWQDIVIRSFSCMMELWWIMMFLQRCFPIRNWRSIRWIIRCLPRYAVSFA